MKKTLKGLLLGILSICMAISMAAMLSACDVEIVWPGEGETASSSTTSSSNASSSDTTDSTDDNEEEVDEDAALLAVIQKLDYTVYDCSTLYAVYGGTVDFSSILESASIAEYGDGYYLKLEFGTYYLNYSGTEMTFFVSPSGDLGVYDDGAWLIGEEDGVYCVESEDTLYSSVSGTSTYVTELYLPVSELTDTYSLALMFDCYRNNCQFGTENPSSSSSDAILTLQSTTDVLAALDYTVYDSSTLYAVYGGTVDFSSILESASVAEYGDGYYLKLEFGTYYLNYSGTEMTFFVSPSGDLGVYDGGAWLIGEEDGVYYVESEDTLYSSVSGTSTYVTELYLPVSELTDTYSLALMFDCYRNNCQFGTENPSSSSSDAILTLA